MVFQMAEMIINPAREERMSDRVEERAAGLGGEGVSNQRKALPLCQEI